MTNEKEDYIPYGEEWVKELTKLPKKFLIENLLRRALLKVKELDKQESEPTQAEIIESDMSAKEFYENTFDLSFMTADEAETIFKATELFAQGKVRVELAKHHNQNK